MPLTRLSVSVISFRNQKLTSITATITGYCFVYYWAGALLLSPPCTEPAVVPRIRQTFEKPSRIPRLLPQIQTPAPLASGQNSETEAGKSVWNAPFAVNQLSWLITYTPTYMQQCVHWNVSNVPSFMKHLYSKKFQFQMLPLFLPYFHLSF